MGFIDNPLYPFFIAVERYAPARRPFRKFESWKAARRGGCALSLRPLTSESNIASCVPPIVIGEGRYHRRTSLSNMPEAHPSFPSPQGGGELGFIMPRM